MMAQLPTIIDPRVIWALRRKRYANRASRRLAGYDWESIRHNRIQIVNRAIVHVGLCSKYLEIGCDNDLCFKAALATTKVGVDPARGGTMRMTSDEFFRRNNDTFDIIFVDGLHSFEQARRDAINGLACLRAGGFMFFHDLLPNSWEEEYPERLAKNWTGDVWKVALELAETTGVTYRTIVADHGVGVLRKESNDYRYADQWDDLHDRPFDFYLDNRDRMKLVTFDEYVQIYFEES